VFNDSDLVPLVQAGVTLPDVVLVKKQFPRRVQAKRKARKWKLKQIEGIETSQMRAADLEKEARDYEQFMDDLEEDGEMRRQINLYKADQVADGMGDLAMEEDDDEDEDEPEDGVRLDEMLDDLTVAEEDERVAAGAQILSEAEANEAPAWALEEL
jgi:nonsense-mediated mRNA decay protein 3